MESITQSPRFDEDGFLIDPESWTDALAGRLAREDEVGELSEDHWSVLRALREHYFNIQGVPAFSHVCALNNLERRCLDGLFKSPREAWRLAGLPNPGEEAKAYM